MKPILSFISAIPLMLVIVAMTTGTAQADILKRKNINDLTEGEKAFIRLGIQRMRLRDITDSNNWIYQANIHGYPKELVDPSAGGCTDADLENDSCEFHGRWIQSDLVCPLMYKDIPTGTGASFYDTEPQSLAWNTCQHGSFYFLPWHRLMLYHFEQILRYEANAAIEELETQAACADLRKVDDFLNQISYETRNTLGMPYWDYSFEGLYESTGHWSTTDTHIPEALSEGYPCTTGSDVQFAKNGGGEVPEISSLMDVVNGCNPLKISDQHRNPVCNDPDQPCIFGAVPTPQRAGIAKYDAISALNLDCACIGDDCSGSSCDVNNTFSSFHGLQVAPVANPAEHGLHSGEQEGAMEDTPHTWIHSALGDIVTDVEGLAGYMTSNACAGREPAFYLHHANIDRLWQIWANIDEHKDPVESPGWQNQEFYFSMPDGNQSPINTPCHAVDMKQLNYGYFYIDNDGKEQQLAINTSAACENLPPFNASPSPTESYRKPFHKGLRNKLFKWAYRYKRRRQCGLN